MAPPRQKVLLVVLDGFGLRDATEANAIALARMPTWNALRERFPMTALQTAGLAVGLPEGQMGNSEVGHTNIGAGRIVYQDLVRINRACAEGLERNPVLRDALECARAPGRRLHLLGLVSDGGVHSSLEHLEALLAAARRLGVSEVFIHAFLDGRDTPPKSALGYLSRLEAQMARLGLGRIATVSGRYYAMDRDQRWDRVERAWNALVNGVGPVAPSAEAAVRASWAENITDEFVVPHVVAGASEAQRGMLRDGDVAVFFNFRADRARELTWALTDPAFQGFVRRPPALARLVCMTQYDEKLAHLPTAFGPEQPTHIFPELVANAGWRQFRTAETEKYAHVTFFFNGGREVLFPGEDRFLVPSPRDVKTYDEMPEMSARAVTDELCRRLASRTYAFALVNYANPDMVGHTGVLPAAIRALEVVDECLGRVWTCCQENDYALVLTADHGNVEQMVDFETGQPHTAHTLNPVPFVLAHQDWVGHALRPGVLADIAPTLCTLMGLEKPPEMTRWGLFADGT